MRNVVVIFFLLLASGCNVLPSSPDEILAPEDAGVRHLPIEALGFAKNDMNPVDAHDSALYTDSVYQYGAFLAADGNLWLGKRRIGEDRWEVQSADVQIPTDSGLGIQDFVVDNAGYLHIVWAAGVDNTLHHVRGVAPGSLMLSSPGKVGEINDKNIKAKFVKLPAQGVAVIYSSARAGLVSAKQNVDGQSWQHEPLIASQSWTESVQWDVYQQLDGSVHLAWRTVTNTQSARIYYAFSPDGGKKWQWSQGPGGDGQDGKRLAHTLPLENINAALVSEGVMHSGEPSPLHVVTDTYGTPYIGSYHPSAEQPSIAKFRVSYWDDESWHSVSVPKVIPTLDAREKVAPKVAIVGESKNGVRKFHVIYRDGSQGGRLVAASNRLGDEFWQYRYLTNGDAYHWASSIDPQLWQRMRQLHLTYRDASGVPQLMIWSADWEHHLRQYATGDVHTTSSRIAKDQKSLFERRVIMDYARRVADWQWANMPDPNGWHFEPRAWGLCPLYIGSLDVVPALKQAGFDGDDLYQTMVRQAQSVDYSLRNQSPYDADDYCVTQAYLRLYQDHPDEQILKPSQERLDEILSNPSQYNLDWGFRHARDRWSWSDALYMGPMSWLLMWEVTGDERYLEFMNREWWATSERLYRPEIGLFFRDESYLDVREKNGKTVHWARGTSWSFAGLAQVIEHLPKSHPDYPRYVEQFRQMAEAFVRAQQDDGLWRPGLLDPETHNARETSGSSFISFGLASGINQGILDRAEYLPHVKSAWQALTASVADSGKFMNVQPVGAGPHGFDPDNSEAFAAGAFLQLATELYEIPDLAVD